MTATCTHCGRIWTVSIRTSPAGYVCPDCDLRQRYIAAGVIVPAETGRKEKTMTLEQKRIDQLYDLLHQLEKKDPDTAAVLRWAIFELERQFG